MGAHQYDEGHTVAGWTGFGIATLGAVVLGLGVCTASAAVLLAGLGVVAVSVLVTWALHLAGWGKPPGRRDRREWGWRVRDLSAREGHPGCVGCRLAGRGRRRAVPDVAVSAAADAVTASPVSAESRR
ncbi:HGxxPAAW family protein [Streptomyces sp. 7R007]